MRTTLDLDDDVLAAAKALAKAGNTTAGRIISDTMRRAIQSGLADPPGPTVGAHASGQAEPVPSAHGFVSLTATTSTTEGSWLGCRRTQMAGPVALSP